MVITSALITVVVLVISYGIGALYYYFLQDGSTGEKRKQLDQTTSIVINFVIFIWLGKIATHLPIFVRDPLAVLAYPSNQVAFYVATFFFIVYFLIQTKREKIIGEDVFPVVIPVLFVTQFVYELIQFLYMKEKSALPLVIFLAVLVIIDLFLKERTKRRIERLLFSVWLLGLAVFSFMSTYPTLFGYRLHVVFYTILIILVGSYFVYNGKRKV